MNEDTKIDATYKEAFNQGYELSKELGLKPDVLKDLSSGSHRMQAMKEGMEQYAKDLTQEKGKEIIPPLDMDNLDSDSIDLETPDKPRDKDRDISI